MYLMMLCQLYISAVDDELEWREKEVLMFYPSICLKGLRKTSQRMLSTWLVFRLEHESSFTLLIRTFLNKVVIIVVVHSFNMRPEYN
jgi:hypothetical protein